MSSVGDMKVRNSDASTQWCTMDTRNLDITFASLRNATSMYKKNTFLAKTPKMILTFKVYFEKHLFSLIFLG